MNLKKCDASHHTVVRSDKWSYLNNNLIYIQINSTGSLKFRGFESNYLCQDKRIEWEMLNYVCLYGHVLSP